MVLHMGIWRWPRWLGRSLQKFRHETALPRDAGRVSFGKVLRAEAELPLLFDFQILFTFIHPALLQSQSLTTQGMTGTILPLDLSLKLASPASVLSIRPPSESQSPAGEGRMDQPSPNRPLI